MLAGSWGFSFFMFFCLVFGVVDLILKPSVAAVWFLVSQFLFSLGMFMLARFGSDL